MAEQVALDRLDQATRIVLYGAGALAVVAGPILFLAPHDTGSYFAWKIGNPLTPSFMGANYLAGAGAVWAARINRWSVTRVIMPAILVFGLSQLVATLIHLDILDWSHPAAEAWLAVYIISPIGVLWVMIQQERRWRGAPGEGPRLAITWRALLGAFALCSFALGAVFFVHPSALFDAWPWKLTPFTGRVIGGWYLSGAALQLMLAKTRDLDTARVGLLATVAVTVLQLIGALMNRSSFTGPSASIAGYCAYSGALGLTAVATWAWARGSRAVALPAQT